MNINVKAVWDEDGEVWSGHSDDCFGLIAEGHSLDNLVEKIASTFTDLHLVYNNKLPESVNFKIDCEGIKPAGTRSRCELYFNLSFGTHEENKTRQG